MRYASLASQRLKPPQVLGRKRAHAAISISAVDDNGVSYSGGNKDDVSGAVREEVCVSLLMVSSQLSILQSPCAWQRFRTRYCPRMRPTLGTFLPSTSHLNCEMTQIKSSEKTRHSGAIW